MGLTRYGIIKNLASNALYGGVGDVLDAYDAGVATFARSYLRGSNHG